MSNYRRLPLSALRAFEAAARHLSFTKAANELSVTQAAVSRHILTLEDHLDTQLFNRGNQKVSLSPAGEELFEAATLSLAHIAAAFDSVKRGQKARRLTVGMPMSFATLFMSHRIGDFVVNNPEVDLHLVSLERSPAPATDGFDVSVVMGYLARPGFTATELFGEEVFPVCSKSYQTHSPRILTPEDLINEVLLDMDDQHWSAYPWSPFNWAHWLGQFGVSSDFKRAITFTSYPTMIQSVIKGYGIGLGFRHLVSDYLNEGTLIRPLSESYQTGRKHHLVIPDTAIGRDDVQIFRNWLITQVADLNPVPPASAGENIKAAPVAPTEISAGHPDLTSA
ncbi:LysR substrate-binding domain-containing protein [Mesorhizobium sp.]|uniref:LysR substrate-binding domain-containing protein n=1 Tax=Mesorhizobium sp. TaxID=1871066 RepID=UPI000FE3F76F|nr:LysR substrate-binding domain-containing protein [Mesorhizobium sp.]RWN50303.1 MAG: LysR family transcriptional regulator [Mesorhizobium sp.]RWN71275.1 MAG: LysR family transcriptional regulator [Mesorhizobium sp.]RWN72018.1 MAG: LysR family transcriptional regulator [Mesorhizobium sp.]RWN82258.1 MAG: LysR family transcriptional regulator [Mesorhizobium sp.]RWO07507.1 MAG: LysR family transcriptional regulator [Mesorhizobium sp.]